MLGELGGQEDANVITFEGAEMTHFLKMKPQLLKAFIKARMLDDATATDLEKKPMKGPISEAEKGVQCKRTSKPVLIRWAHIVRGHPVKAKISVHRAEQAEISQVQHLCTRTDEEGEGDVDFLDEMPEYRTKLLAKTQTMSQRTRKTHGRTFLTAKMMNDESDD
jgi:predicted component of type VI protein secretion system